MIYMSYPVYANKWMNNQTTTVPTHLATTYIEKGNFEAKLYVPDMCTTGTASTHRLGQCKTSLDHLVVSSAIGGRRVVGSILFHPHPV